LTVTTIILTKAPYGEESSWNALRLAHALCAKGINVNIFLLGDGVFLAKKGQTTPAGYYNLENMLEDLIKKGVTVGVCGTCVKSRGLSEEELISGAKIGKMMDLADWIKESQHVLTF
jgi:sulfur relay (sulfurtransferase) complex TusBCD TusD component (DsrE family)